MSYGTDIRAQKSVATAIATSLSTSATSTRTSIGTMTWESGAGDLCKATLRRFAATLDERSADVTHLANALEEFASDADSLHELKVLAAPVADAWHTVTESAERGLNSVLHPHFVGSGR